MLFQGERERCDLHFFKNCREDLSWPLSDLPLRGILSSGRTSYSIWEEVSTRIWASSQLCGISGGHLCQSEAWSRRRRMLLPWAVLYICVSNVLALIIAQGSERRIPLGIHIGLACSALQQIFREDCFSDCFSSARKCLSYQVISNLNEQHKYQKSRGKWRLRKRSYEFVPPVAGNWECEGQI